MSVQQWLIVLCASLSLMTAPMTVADDDNGDSPGFFERVWEGTKDIFGIGGGERKKSKDRRKDRDDDDDQGEDKDRHKGKSSDLERDILRVIFGDDEKDIIRDYFGKSGKKQKPIPPGLKKKVERGGELPPGWQKKVARGEVLPEDLYRYGQGIPDDLYGRLPRHPKGTSIRVFDNKVVRVIDATREIIDVFDL